MYILHNYRVFLISTSTLRLTKPLFTFFLRHLPNGNVEVQDDDGDPFIKSGIINQNTVLTTEENIEVDGSQ